MADKTDACAFLNEQGRCGIHSFRPGFCRMFPLGRIYENQSFQYFLQVHECAMEPKSKVKINKWIGIPDIRRYETFVTDWHYLLKTFYLMPYDESQDFYSQFQERLEKAGKFFS